MKPAFKALLLLLGTLLPPLIAQAQTQSQGGIPPYVEYRKRVETSQNISPLDVGLFREEISLYNGSTTFSVTDIDVPGSNGLPVRLSRRLAVDLQQQTAIATYDSLLRGAGNWDVDVPWMGATYASSAGNALRCDGGYVPPLVMGALSAFRRGDVWQGISVNIPGRGTTFTMGIQTQAPKPSVAAAWRLTTSQRDHFDCIPMRAGFSGQGFRMTTASGLHYFFDVATSRTAARLAKSVKGSNGMYADVYLDRNKLYLLASRIEDRFGNSVQFQYNANGHPVRIWSNDGRDIQLAYSGNRLATATTNGRSWQYVYSGDDLTSVTFPDTSRWQYAYSGTLKPYPDPNGVPQLPLCAGMPAMQDVSFALTATHPSGATGVFQFGNHRHFRSGVHATECVQSGDPYNPNYDLLTPHYFDVLGIDSKQITGPGLPSMTWTYDYGLNGQTLWGVHTEPATYPCTTCDPSKSVTVTNPDGTKTRHHFGIRYHDNDGRQLGTDKLDSAGAVVRSESSTYLAEAQVPGQAFFGAYGSVLGAVSDPASARIRPVVSRTITQQGSTYTTTVPQCGPALCFDAFARPTSETKSSSLGYTKTDTTEYHDDLNAWVLGQVKRTTTNGIETARTSFDTRSMPWQQYAFGKLQQTLTYHPDGTVATVADGRGLTTTLNSWKRGIPQSIQYADGTSQSAVVNDNGWITSVTDQNGFTSQYDYDAMGRMKALFYPTGDSTAWNPVSIQFNPVPHADRGLPAGHWRQDRFEGNRHTHTYFDALWRPVMTLDYDVASAGHNVQTHTITRYDTQGRVAFKSYPARHVGDVNASLPGTRTQYDALDRVTRVEQDSEHGPLVTTTEYLHGNSIRTTNPRGHATTSHYVAYDQPAYDLLAWSAQPEGRTIEIHRDVFGKPLWMRQRAADNSAAAIRHFVYDTPQQLCKSIEPETGATVMDYDAAGNLAWTASGLNLPSTTDCNFNEAWYSGRRSDRGYDNRNRLSTLAFADGRGNQQWQYTADGLPAQITTWNTPGNANPVINAYTYNKRRLLTGESVTQPGWYSWSLGYGYNANGQLASQVYPDGFTVNYSPNALGQPTEVRDASGKAYASNVSYYPNGGMSGFTYGNGVMHGMQQNLRQLPERSIDNGVINFGYAYDAAANPTAIYDDQLGPAYHRSMQYDALDRLTAVGSASFGGDHWHRFSYNALDNLTSWTLAGAKDYAIYGYDANNRLTDIRNTAGATVVGLGYDVQGNLANKNGQQYTFDMGNRLREVPGKESYRYDGHGRRVQSTAAGTGDVLSLYSNAGTLMRQESQRTGRKENMIHLNGSLIAKQVHTTPPLPPPAAPVLTAPAQASSGDFNLSWTSVERATRYVLEENPNSAGWTALQDGAGLNRAVTGKPPGSYVYRVKACNTSGCSAESAVKTVTVPNAPANAPNLTTPASSTTGNYAVSWTGPATASRHVLEENANGAGWVGIHDGMGTSKSISGKTSGNYAYRVKGCNAAGCGPWTAQKTVLVNLPTQPPPTPTITQSFSMRNSATNVVRCGAEWTAAATATSYELKASTEVVQYQGIKTYVVGRGNAYCASSHTVRACNVVGCSAWSSPPFNQVEIPWTYTLPGVP